MAKTRSMTRNRNDDDDIPSSASASCSKKWLKTFDNGDVASWSDLIHDVLLLVIMQLGVADFVAFSRVCKSWRSLAISIKNKFMASKPPINIGVKSHANNKDYYYCLQDYEGKSFKTIIPDPIGRICVGLTCGYLIFFCRETRDFWLVNPITSHELHFPDYPLYVDAYQAIKGILVFSPSMSGLVFVVSHSKSPCYEQKISYSIAGKGRWNHVSPTLPVLDLHVFKGKIYTLHKNCCLGELRLEGKWTLLDTKIFQTLDLLNPRLVSSNENFYVINWGSRPKKIMELDFGEMEWVSPVNTKTVEEYAIFLSYFKSCVAIKPESGDGPWTQYKTYGCFLDSGEGRKGVLFYEGTLYFPHDCLNVNLLDEQ